MGFVGGLLGMGSKGASYSPQKANVIQPTDLGQIGNSYNQSQAGLAQQQALIQALQAQNGIGNQSNVFNQQQGLANQLQGVANGAGPNPALQQLQNTTGQNVANQAALMAGQRGSGANAGLLARQAAMQGGALQQQAVGQGAALQAQQQLAAMNALQNQQAQMAGLAGQQVGQLGNATTGYNQAAQSEQQNLLNAMQGYNNANVAAQGNVNEVQGKLAQGAQEGQQGLFGGLLGAAGTGLNMIASPSLKNLGNSLAGNSTPSVYNSSDNPTAFNPGNFQLKARGGMVDHYDEGGIVSGPQSNVGKFLFSSAPSQQTSDQSGNLADSTSSAGGQQVQGGLSDLLGGLGGLIGPLTGIMSGGAAAGAGGGGAAVEAIPLLAAAHKGGMMNAKQGGKVPGQAQVAGDSLKNDTVHAMLSPKEIVLPRSVTLAKDAPEKAKQFVIAELRKRAKK